MIRWRPALARPPPRATHFYPTTLCLYFNTNLGATLIDDSCEDEKQAARRAGLAFEVALIQSAQSAVVDAPGEGV